MSEITIIPYQHDDDDEKMENQTFVIIENYVKKKKTKNQYTFPP